MTNFRLALAPAPTLLRSIKGHPGPAPVIDFDLSATKVSVLLSVIDTFLEI